MLLTLNRTICAGRARAQTLENLKKGDIWLEFGRCSEGGGGGGGEGGDGLQWSQANG